MEFTDRVAVVTGGASGIGAASAEALRAEGATVVTWDLSDGADIRVDTSDEASVVAAADETVGRFGAPSLLVAAAGVPGPSAPVNELDFAQWTRTFGVNIHGVFLSVREVSRRAIEADLDGSFVLISSVQGTIADPSLAAYSSTKAAVNHFARVAAIDLGQHGIRVNAVGPGPTSTPMTAPLAASATWTREVEDVTPLHAVGQPEQIAAAIVNLMRADWITGQVVNVDGGSSLMTARGASRAKIAPKNQ
jgi:NAD(P)-dependent dehydrogenase (short-subunit alcohol dehydrogenase family)